MLQFDADALLREMSEEQVKALAAAIKRRTPKAVGKKLKFPAKVNCFVRFADGAQFGLSVQSHYPGYADAPVQAVRTASAIYLSRRATSWEWRRDGKHGSQVLRPVGTLPDVIEARILSEDDMESRRGVRKFGLNPDADADVIGDQEAMEARRDAREKEWQDAGNRRFGAAA